EHLRAAVGLFIQIQEASIHIVTTNPERIFRHDSKDMIDIIIAVVELSRGHGESARKSELLGEVWGEKKRRGREGEDQKATNMMGEGRVAMTTQMPAWCELRDGKVGLDLVRATVVKHIFSLAADGYGYTSICKKLKADKVPAFSTRGRSSGRWT